MTPAVLGWIVLGVLCAAALILMLLGVLQVTRAQRRLKSALQRVRENQRRVLDPHRLDAALTRLARDAETAKQLMERASRALSTIGIAIRYCAVALRIIKALT